MIYSSLFPNICSHILLLNLCSCIGQTNIKQIKQNIRAKRQTVIKIFSKMRNSAYPHKSSSLMKQRETNFTLQWKLHDKKGAYNALEDRHTSYYFGSKPVKTHLKKLKKVIMKEETLSKKSTDEQIKQIIKWSPEEYEFQTVDMNCSRGRQRKHDVHNLSKIVPYEQEMKAGSIEKLNRTKKIWIGKKLGNISPQKYQQILEMTSLCKKKSRSVASTKPQTKYQTLSKKSNRDSQITYYTTLTKNNMGRQSHLPKLSEQPRKRPRVSFALG